ncbi:MAG TPA: YifB family Mg chelatase-like AAA ATPase [Candidatus Limnocylindrales bacterium]|nr:YifB family Mg chelatase-like AAA ATPase [Candidatus Limnocylindrales bacterium]
MPGGRRKKISTFTAPASIQYQNSEGVTVILAKIHSCAVLGVQGIPLDIEVDITDGLPAFDIIGLPDASVREAKERVRAAIRNSGFKFPYSRVTVNLAPADIKKEGSSFDLAIAIGLLAATKQIPQGEPLQKAVFVGELSLDGSLRSITGTLAMALSLNELDDFKNCTLYLPETNSTEAALIRDITVKGASTLTQLANFFCGIGELPTAQPVLIQLQKADSTELNFSEVRGQETAKRALEIAAAGAHNVLLFGPPGSGKTMLARRIPSILPSPNLEEILEITRIHSVAGQLTASKPLLTQRPFRSPHHSASTAGIIGGGKTPRPGEVSLAHLGVLFFDELPEYNREVLEALRQPLEDRMVTITRVAAAITYPADFMFIASMNPCPCGNYGDPRRECRCSPTQVHRYRSRLSGPLLDRLDIQVEVPGIKFEQLQQQEPEECSSEIRKRVERARAMQWKRYKKLKVNVNAQLRARHFEKYCPLTQEARQLLHQAFQNLNLSMRAHDRIIKVARTIADIEKSEMIEALHIAEAVQYRTLDRQ